MLAVPINTVDGSDSMMVPQVPEPVGEVLDLGVQDRGLAPVLAGEIELCDLRAAWYRPDDSIVRIVGLEVLGDRLAHDRELAMAGKPQALTDPLEFPR